MKRFGLLVSIMMCGGVQAAVAQGVNDYTGPAPRTQATAPLPSNTTPPTVNRPSNIFSPGAPTPRARRVYKGAPRRF